MAGAAAAAAAAPAARGELFPAAGASWRRRWRRLGSAAPGGPGLGLLGLLVSRLCCGTLAGPVVDPHVTAVWGKKVALKCIIDVNETITQVSWEKMHGKISETIAVHHPEYGISIQGKYQGRVSFKNYSLTDATIILKNVSFSDAGEYICKAVTFPLGNAQSSITVTVLVEPVVSLTKGPNPLIDGANQTTAAICTAATGKPAAEIDWEGGLGEMESSSTLFPNETVTVVSQYNIVPTRFARGRRITCIVKHPALEKEIRYSHVLDIQYAPEVSVTGYDGNWFIGRENVQLRCNADANPLPMELIWTRLDGQWPEGLLSVNNTLQFTSPLTYNYTGTYICKVTNALGQRSDQKTIYISGTLAGPVVDPHVTAVWGKKVALKCIIDVNETITQVSWEKMHGKISETIAVHHPEYGISIQGKYQGRVSFKNYSLTDATIILKNVSFSDAGEYICKAVTFPLGNAQSSITVTVLVEPVVSLTKGPNPLIDGANQTTAAICTAATGKPAAEIDWEGGLGEMESSSTLFPNETVTVVSQYNIVPTRFARGRRITCIVKHPALEKEIRYSHVLDIQYAPEVSVTGYDGNWFIGRENVQLRCNADANPLPMELIWTRLDGQWPEGLLSVNNTLQFTSPLTYNYTGTYICKVTNALGQRSDQKTIYISDPPTTTTRLPTVPWHPSTDGITGLATEPRIIDFPTSSLPAMQEDTWGTVIGSAVGGALFLILVSVLVGIICYRRRRTFRGDYFAKNYIPPSDMQKESQIDVLQSDDVDSYPDSIKKEIKHPMNSLISKDYLEDPEKPEWNNLDNINRYQERYERPMDYYEGGTLGMKYMGGECYDDNEEDFVSHIDGSVISRREWYV